MARASWSDRILDSPKSSSIATDKRKQGSRHRKAITADQGRSLVYD